jgi:NADH-quinone oxidoreductase subunit K
VAFARAREVALGQPFYDGQIFVFFVIAVAAAEVAVGLALIVEIFKSKRSIDVDQMSSLKG